METFPVGWLAEFEMEEEEDHVLIDKMDSLDDLTPQQFAALYNENFQDTFNTSSDTTEASQIRIEKPTKQLKSATTEQRSSHQLQASTFPSVLCFENRVGSAKSKGDDQNYAPKFGGKKKRADNPSTRPPCTIDHVIAERKRREKLGQQFIALSAIVPGLKKMDKASVLGACMKYITHLQTRVQTLEEQTSKKAMESAVFVKKFQVSSDTDDSSFSNESSSDFSHDPLPEIDAKISDRNVLIRIHCERHRGVMAQTLLEIEKLNLNVISSSVTPFGSFTFDITVIAQMNDECNMVVRDLVKKLRSSIVQFVRNNLLED